MPGGDTAELDCCPECGSARFSFRADSPKDHDRRSDARFFCRDCRADFDEPATKPGVSQQPRRGTAADLLAADPEEVP